MNSLYDYSILTEAIIVFTWATPAWYMYITFRESGRSQRSAWIAFAIPLFWAALAWYLAKYGALDAAFDTFYVHEYFHEAQGFAAVPFVQRGGIKERKFSDDGLQYHKSNPDYADGVWAIVSVDLSKLSGKTRRVNITLPERVLNLMDKYATEHGETRSGFITSPSAGGCTPSSTCLCGIGTQGGRCLALPILRGSAAPLSS